MITQERKGQLEAAYHENITTGRAPYADVFICSTEEMALIFDQRNWSAQFWLTEDKSRADLSGADLSGANLSDANLSGANLSGANLSGADLSGANLSGANLSDAKLRDAKLRDANLSRANLSRADLRRSNLSGADLSGADLSGADLRDAKLRDAKLRDANFSDANLSRADLRGADLRRSNLSDANLSGADLSHAKLSGANLSDANLETIKRDIFAVLDAAPREASYVLEALEQGNVDGTLYLSDDATCGCLVGSLEIARAKRLQVRVPEVEGSVVPRDASRPAERWFSSIVRGDRPSTSQVVKITHDWIAERVAFYASDSVSWP